MDKKLVLHIVQDLFYALWSNNPVPKRSFGALFHHASSYCATRLPKGLFLCFQILLCEKPHTYNEGYRVNFFTVVWFIQGGFVYMVVKRLLAVTMALFVTVTSVNAGNITSYASDYHFDENEAIVLDETPDAEADFTEEAIEDESLYQEIDETNVDTFDIVTEEDAEFTAAGDPILSKGGFYLDANGGTFPNGRPIIGHPYNEYLYIWPEKYEPSKEGYTFVGWYAEPEGTTRLSEDDVTYYLKKHPAEKATLYAKWSKYHTVTFVAAPYGYELRDLSLTQLEYEIPENESIQPIQVQHPYENDPHYSFEGWYLDEARTIKAEDPVGLVPTEDMTFYAGFKKDSNVITFHINSDTAKFLHHIKHHNSEEGFFEETLYKTTGNATFYIYFDRDIYNPDGKVIEGFYLDEACSPEKCISKGDIVIYPFNEDTDVYIKWVDPEAYITFDLNSDTGYFYYIPDSFQYDYVEQTTPRKLVASDSAESKYDPGKIGNKDLSKKFLGWSRSKTAKVPDKGFESKGRSSHSNISDVYHGDVTTSLESGTTLYGVWSDDYYIVTFEAGEGTFEDSYGYQGDASDNKTAKCQVLKGSNIDSVPTPKYKDDTKVFAHWLDKNGKIQSELYSYRPKSDITLTAVFSEYHTVTLNANGGSFEDYDTYYEEAEQKVTVLTIYESIYTNEYVPIAPSKKIKFLGYGENKDDNKVTYKLGSAITPTEDMYLYAKWSSGSGKSEDPDEKDVPDGAIAFSSVKLSGFKSTVSYTGSSLTLSDLFNAKDKTCQKSGWNEVTLYTTDKKTKETKVLSEGTDYNVTIEDKSDVGKIKVTFTGINNYKGTIEKTVTIKAANVAKDFDISVAGAIYSKAGARPAVTVKYADRTLLEGTDYTVTYKNNKKAGLTSAKNAPYVTVKAKGNYSGTSQKVYFTIEKADVSALEMQVKDVTYKSKGKKGYFVVKPTFTDNGKKVTVGKNKDIKATYTYTYAKDTTLKDGSVKAAGEVVDPKDKLSGPTSIQVTAEIEAGGIKSSYSGTTTLTRVYNVVIK